MKKRVFAILLAAALCIGLLPTNVLAEETSAAEEIKEEEIAVTAAQAEELTADGDNEETAGTDAEEDSAGSSVDSEQASEDEADVETAADWEAALPQDLTGIWSEDVAAVAKSQIGYTESEGYNRYGAWYGNDYDDWDVLFVSFCLYYAEVPESEFPQASEADAWAAALKNAGQEAEVQLYADVSDYIPQPGDLVFLDTDGDEKADRVGIADKVETEETDTDADEEEAAAEETVQKITVIEGDSDDAVEETEYTSDGGELISEDTDELSVITGYGILPLQEDAEDAEDAEDTEEGAADEEEEEENEEVTDDAQDADIAELAWSDASRGKVVLNLGNGNGKYNNADYTNNRHEGTLLRYTTDSLVAYADSDGNVTINLPSDSNLNSTFTVVNATNTLDAVTVALGRDLAYDYKLIGWVNIATGEYYDVSGGSTTATIDLANDNVFYADWIAATYDHGDDADAGLRDDIVSTSGFVTIHMYDYNDLFNLYSESLVQNEDDDGTLWEAWTDSGSLYYNLNHTGLPATDSFLFVNNGTVSYSSVQGQQSTGGMLTWPNNKTNGNTWTGTGVAPRDATEIWGITSPYSAPMNMLFDPNSEALGVHYVGEADYLFWKDSDGYYTYNSKEAAATYNQTDECFYVYDDIQNVEYTDFSCFLPYNTYGETLSAMNGTVNYFFGMDMEVNFYLPNATGTTGGNQMNGKDMVFNFSGDDDILIFVDDELVLDMSGIHDEAFGSINFSDGTVRMAMSEAGLETATPTSISLSSGTHDLKVYYMERGGYASNLEIQFNVVSLWEYETGDVKTVTAEKTWLDAKGNEIDPDDLPDVYKTNGVEVGLFDVLQAETEDTFGYTRDGDSYLVTYIDDKGITHTYRYDPSGPVLYYTETDDSGTTSSYTYNNTNSAGQVVDAEGYVIAWLEGNSLHIRIDQQTLYSENDWSCAWELLDPDGNYEAQELSGGSNYTTTGSSANLLRYLYWSIIGDSQIEDSFKIEEGDPLQVILTEAAQEADSALGDTKDALGWVIVATESGITTQQVEFSQIAELQKSEDDSSGQTSYKTVSGVTSQSEIDRLGSGAIWYVIDAENQNTDASGTELEDFYLYCDIEGTQYYLTLQGSGGSYTLGVTSDSDAASRFCYDSLGELLVILDDGSTARVEIDAQGNITIGDAELTAARDDIRIFTLQETETSGFAFTAVNTFLPDILLEKVDEDGEPLTGAAFTLQNADGQYYTYDADTDEVTWSEEAAAVEVDENGKYYFHYLEDGTYTLKETASPDDYVRMNEPVTITLETDDDGNTTVTVSGSEQASVGEDGAVTIEDKLVSPQLSKEIAEDDYERKDQDIEHDDANGHFEENIDGDGWGTWDDADNNQEVTYHLKLTDLEDVQNLTVHDYLEEGLDFEPDTVEISLYDGDTEKALVEGTDYTLTQGACSDPDCQMEGCTYEVKFANDLFENISSEAYIVITYKALTETHEEDYDDYMDEILNQSYMTYGVSMLRRSGIVTTATDLFGFGIYKYAEENGTEAALAGAEFILERGGVYATFETETDADTGEVYYMIYSWVEDKDSAGILTSGSDGVIRIDGLDDDTYTITETKAPTGYEILDETITVVIDEDGNITADGDTGSKEAVSGHEVNVENTQILTSLEGAKTWNDEDNENGKRPSEITIHLLANGTEVDRKTVTEADDWKWSFTDLPAYSQGIRITYTITEDVVADYTTQVNGYDVVNNYTPGKVGLNVQKIWDDKDDQDGIRPDSITVELLKNGEKTGDTLTLNESNGWAGNFSDLDEYTEGTLNEYTVEESSVDGYETAVSNSNGTSSIIITNTHTPETKEETRDISGFKTWEDNDDKADARPDSITVNLYQNGKLYDSKTVTAGDGWAWSWTDLPKNDDQGEAYAYTIDEDEVEYYTPTYYEGNFNITNTFEGEEGARTPISGPDQGGDNPKTGDSNNLLLWALVLLLCGLVLAEVYEVRKRIIH